MEAGRAIFEAVTPILVILLLGFFCRKKEFLQPEFDEPLMKLAVSILFPGLILHSMLGNPLVRDVGLVLSSAGVGFGMVVLFSALALAAASLFGFKKGDGLRTFGLAGGVQNYGFFAIPLIVTLFPFEAGGHHESLGVLFTHNLGVELAIWSVGIAILTGSPRSLLQAFKKGPILAVLVGLFLVWTGLDLWIPAVLLTVASLLGACAVPIGIFLVGLEFANLWGKEKTKPKVVFASILMRNFLAPVVYFLIIWLVPLGLPLKQVLVIQSAMPAAVFPVVIARFYGGQPEVAAQVAIATSCASLVTLPLIIFLGMQWFV